MSAFKIKKLTAYSLQLTAVAIIVSMAIFVAGGLQGAGEDIDYYTCGMHPSVKVSAQDYEAGSKNCPICSMLLTPVYKEEISSREDATGSEGIFSRVKIKAEQAKLAGVQTESVKKRHLTREIRTVGTIAYDPELVVAEDEFISGLEALDKINKGSIPEIKERAQGLVESSRRRLGLLGLSEEQIAGLEQTRRAHSNLILPEEKMWLYGEAYEYELPWIRTGSEVTAVTSSIPGEEFKGVISSVNPVLDKKTRSVTFRAEIENPDLKLKPQMYMDVVIKSMYMGPDGEHMNLAVPRDAVLDTGLRKVVWIDKGNTEYEGREVAVGPEAVAEINGVKKKYYPVLKGVAEGEKVVTKANFLIDSQSQISGVAAAAYSGAVGVEEKTPAAPVHQH